MSKRFRAELEAQERELEKTHPLPPYKPPAPWTNEELDKLSEMQSVLNRLTYNQSHDIDAVFEFLRFDYLFGGGSVRIMELRTQAQHYQDLRRPAAKYKLWQKIMGNLHALQTELSRRRHSRELGGTTVQ